MQKRGKKCPNKDSPAEQTTLAQSEAVFQGWWGKEGAKERYFLEGKFQDLIGRAEELGGLWGAGAQEKIRSRWDLDFPPPTPSSVPTPHLTPDH